MTHYHHKIPWEVTDRLQREEIGANMPREAQNGGSRCRRCFQTPCIREIRHSLTHIPTLPSLCDPTLGVRRRRSSGKLPVIEDGVFESRDLSQSFFYGHVRVAKCSPFSRNRTGSHANAHVFFYSCVRDSFFDEREKS